MIHKFTISVNDSIFKQLVKRAGNSNQIPSYVTNVLANISDYNPNVENSNFVGKKITGKSINQHFNTVVMGGSNYPYKLTNTSKVSNSDIYRIINFDNGEFTLYKIN